MSGYHIAQVNIGRVRAPLEDARMAGFVNRLQEINALPMAAQASFGACKPPLEMRLICVPTMTTAS